MRVTTKGQYALETMTYLACMQDKGPVAIKQVSESTGISQRYAEQIFFKLRKCDLLEAVRGTNGGYRLRKPPCEITVRQILEAAEGELVPVPCVYDKQACKSGISDSCATREMWLQMLKTMQQVLENVTLEHLRNRCNQLGEKA